MIVKLKVSKFCIPIQLGIPIVPFFGRERGFESLLPTILPILHKFSPEVVFKQRKLMFEQYLKNSRLYGDNSDPKFALSVQL